MAQKFLTGINIVGDALSISGTSAISSTRGASFTTLSSDTLGVANAATFSGNIQLVGTFKVLNKAQTAYINLAARDTSGSEVVYNLTNVGSAIFAGDVNTLGDVHIDEGSTSGHQTSNKVRFGHTSWQNNMGIESYWMVLGCNQNEGFKFRDSTNNIILQLQGNNNSGGNGPLSATFAGNITFSSGSDIIFPDNNGAALEFKEGSNLYMRFITTNGSEAIQMEKATTISNAVAVNSLNVNYGALSISSDNANHVTFTESGSGDFTIDAPDDIRLDAGGGDIALRDDGTEYGRVTNNNPGLKISSSVANSSINLIPNGTGNVYAYTDSVIIAGGEAESTQLMFRTDEGDDNGDDWVIKHPTSNELLFQNDISGSQVTLFSITPSASASSSIATFAGNVVVGGNITGINGRNIVFDQNNDNYIYALAGTSSKINLMANHSLVFKTAAAQTTALTINNTQDAIFVGDVTVGALTSGQTAQLVINHEGGVPSIAAFKARTNRGHISIADNDTTGYISAEGGIFGVGRTASLSANNININASHQVGIGTITPGYKLEVSEDTDSTVNLLRLRNADSNYAQTYDFQLDTSKDLVITGSSGAGGVNFVPGSRGVKVTGDLAVTGNAVVSGNLEVTGITTTTNVVNLDVSDNIIGLNRGSTSNANDSGLIIERGSTGDNAAFLWDESEDRFIFGTTTATPAATGDITSAYAPIVAKGFWTTSSSTAHWGPATTVYGTLTWDTGYAKIHANGSNSLKLGSGADTDAVIITGSDVAIAGDFTAGAATPNQTLEFNSNSQNPELIIKNNTAQPSTSGTATLQFKQALNATGGKIVSGRDSNYSDGATRDSHLKFYTSLNATDVLAVTIDSNQNTTFASSIDLTGGQVKLRSDVALDHDGSSLYIKAPSLIYFYPGNANKGNIDTSGDLTIARNGDFGGYITVGGANSKFAENNLRFESAGAAYIDHGTTSQSIKFRLSNSSALDVIPFEITPTYAVLTGNLTVTGTLTHDFMIGQIDTTLSGTSTPSAQLTTNYTYTGTNTSGAYARVDYLNIAGSGGSFGNVAGYQMKTNVTSTGTGTAIKNILSRVHTSSAGDISQVANFVTHNEFAGTGNVDNWAGLAVASFGGGFENTRTVGNTYGVYIGDITHGTQTNAPYAIYTGSERIHFGGNLNVAGTSTAASFHGDGSNLTNITTTPITSASGNRWGVYPKVESDGVMEVGKYIDFHTTDGDTSDFSVRISSGSSSLTYANTSSRFTIGSDVGVLGSTDFFIPQGRKLKFDGVSGHTYMEEESDSNLKTYVAGSQRINTTNAVEVHAGPASFNTSQSPIAKVQAGAYTFSGANGVYNNSRIGIMNNGSLTSIVNASTYNDATYPDYGLVFIQGPSTSSYNVWSVSPDGPAKGNDLNFIYAVNTSNIHTTTPKVVFSGDGSVSVAGKLAVNGANKNSNAAMLDVNLAQSNGALGAANSVHFGAHGAHTSGQIMGITLGYKENTNVSYRKIGLVAAGRGDGAARQDFHILVDTVADSGSVALGDSKLKIDGITGAATFAGTVDWSSGNSAQANSAYGWGNHASGGYAADNAVVKLATTQTISGGKTFTNVGNTFNGHLYYTAYDAAGNHYPHFRDGSSNSGANVNWRQYYGSSYKTHTWTSDSSGNMVFTFQGNIGATTFLGDLNGTINTATTAVTQGTTDNTTKVATTAFVQREITELIGGAPGALNTLNELAAAINDDASYATTLTTALALKAPLASPSFTGTITGSATTALTLSLNSTHTNGGYMRMMEGGAAKLFIGTRGSVSGTSGTGYDIYTVAGNDLRFFTHGTNLALTLDTSQNATFASHIHLADSKYVYWGGSNDFYIGHAVTETNIVNSTGALNIQQHQTDGNIVFAADRGDGGGTFDYFSLDGGSTTYASGATTAAYTKWPDNSRIALGTHKDLQIYHDGSHSEISESGTGDLRIRGDSVWIIESDGTNQISAYAGTTKLYKDGNEKLSTVTGGINVTGDTDTDTLTVSGTTTTGTTTNGRTLHGSKSVTLIENTFTDTLTVTMSNHTACYVKIFVTGDWSAHSSVQYLGEYFLTNGAGAYGEPGMIIREVDNTQTDTIVAKLVDPSGTSGNRAFKIQLKADDTVAANNVGAKVTYEVMGQYVSVV